MTDVELMKLMENVRQLDEDPYWSMTTVDETIIRECGFVPGNFSQKGMIRLFTRLSNKYSQIELNLNVPNPEFPVKRHFIWVRYSFKEIRNSDIVLINRETGKEEIIDDLGSHFNAGSLIIKVGSEIERQ